MRNDTTRNGTLRYDAKRHDTERYPAKRRDTTRNGTLRRETARHETTRHEGGTPGRCRPPYFRNPAAGMAGVWAVPVPVGGGQQVAAGRQGALGGIV